MDEPRRRASAAAWGLLAAGLGCLLLTGVVFWALWDEPPGTISFRLLTVPPIIGVVCVGASITLFITKQPFDREETARYPYAPWNRRRDERP